MLTLGELQRIQGAIRQVAGEVAEMLRRAPDRNKRLPHSEWTVGETAAHLAFAQRGMAQIATGAIDNPYDGAKLDDFASINSGYLQSFPERDPVYLAGQIMEGTQEFLSTLSKLPDSDQVASPMGRMDVATLYVYNLGHLLMHGHPLALALGRPTPVNRERALLVVPFLRAVVPKVFDPRAHPGFSARLEIRMRGGPRFYIHFHDGKCTVESSPSGRIDCRISADPAAFFLVSAGVVSQWGPIVKGKMMAWGRKPWLSLRLKNLLPNP